MMANRSFFALPDGSSSRNTPGRCASPRYPQHSAQERYEVLHDDKNVKVKQGAANLKNNKAKQESEVIYIIDDEPCKEETITREMSTDPRATRVTHRNFKAEDKEKGNVKLKGERIATEFNPNPRGMLKHDPRNALKHFRAEEEGRHVKGKRKFLEIGMDGRYTWYNLEKCSENDNVEEDITAYMANEKAMLPKFQPVCYKEEKPFTCPECGKGFTHEKYFTIHYRSHSGEKPYYCSECGKSFSQSGTLNRHKLTHSDAGGYYCPECGQRFPTAWFLAAHRKVHSSENVHR